MDLGQDYHMFDLAVDCRSIAYKGVRVLAWVLLFLLPFGIPAGFGALLYLNRVRLSNDDSDDIGYQVFCKICTSMFPKIDEATLTTIFEDVDIDGSGKLSEREVYSYAFFSELQRRAALSRRAVARQASQKLRVAISSASLMSAVKQSEHEDESDEPDKDGNVESKLLANVMIEQQHDHSRTIHMANIPLFQARNTGVLTEILEQFGKVASLTVRLKPYKGQHKNWAIVSFVNPRAAEKALAGTIAVYDSQENECSLRCTPFDVDEFFKSNSAAKQIWEEHHDARARSLRRPWWFGDKDDYAFLVKLYRPSVYWFEV